LSEFPVGYYSNGDWSTHCQTIGTDAAFSYCEDAVFWDHLDGEGKLKDRLVIVGCDPGRKSWNTVMGPLRDPKPRGGLWVYSPGEGNAKAIVLIGYPEDHDFHPIGMDVFPSLEGDASNLFVINHAGQRTFIEQFSLTPANPTKAKWIRTLTSKYFVSPNSLAWTSPTSFYVTNDHLFTRRLPKPFGSVLPAIETWLGLPLSWISHVTINENAQFESNVLEHTFAALGIPFSNGVAISPDGKHLAVSSSSLAQVYFYTRDPESNKLTFTDTVQLPFAPDNLSFDDEGILIVAGHPHLPSLAAVAANKTAAIGPSWAVSISPRKAGAFSKEYDTRAPVSASAKAPAVPSHEVETLFQSNGKFFSTSATGLRDSRTGVLYVSGLYEEGLLVCTP
jgi:hypothetical protein